MSGYYLENDLDETAHHLMDFYKKRDYRYIETIKWDVTNYKSVIQFILEDFEYARYL